MLDTKLNEPIVFANIRIKGRALGVISNEDGSFRIPLKYKEFGDILEISSMGYETKEILISTLSTDIPIKIYLRTRTFELDETIVRAEKKRRLSARKIIRRALENIPNNYPFQPFSVVGYYRDYQLKGDEYINLNEAILEVFDAGFGTIDSTSTKVQIFENKKNFDFERDTLADKPYNYKTFQKVIDDVYISPYGGNEFALLRVHNAIRNYSLNSFDFINRLKVDLLRNHQFIKEPNTLIEDESLYVIRFKTSMENTNAKGKFYISTKDLSIHKLEYAVYSDHLNRADFDKGVRKRNRRTIYEVNTEYRRYNGKMFLNYISFYNGFRVSKPSPFRIDEIVVDNRGKRFEINFNSEPDERTAEKYHKYNFKFEGKRIKFERLVLFENKVWLYPELKNEKDIAAFAKIAKLSVGNKADKAELKNLLKININNINDKEGNTVNRNYYVDFDQYREFFVQQIKSNSSLPEQGSFMNMGKPIFENQPVVRPDNFDDYWMNTPLQKVGNKKPAEQ